MTSIPHKQATLAFILRDGKVLLGHKIRKGADIGEGTLNGPGGKVEKGQSLEENLVEEVMAEIGLTVLKATKVAEILFHNGTRNRFNVHVFIVTEFTGEPHESAEMREPDDGWWHDTDELPFDRMLASDREWVPRVLRGERLRGEVFQNDDGSVVTRTHFETY